LTRESLEQFAEDAGVSDTSAFSDCFDSDKYTIVVQGNYELARSIGLESTPSFILLAEGEVPKLLKSAHPYSTFEREINEAYGS